MLGNLITFLDFSTWLSGVRGGGGGGQSHSNSLADMDQEWEDGRGHSHSNSLADMDQEWEDGGWGILIVIH